MFLNPCGNTVQVSWDFHPVSGFSHSKAKSFSLSGGRGRQKKASFKSKLLNYTCSYQTGFGGSLEPLPREREKVSGHHGEQHTV